MIASLVLQNSFPWKRDYKLLPIAQRSPQINIKNSDAIVIRSDKEKVTIFVSKNSME